MIFMLFVFNYKFKKYILWKYFKNFLYIVNCRFIESLLLFSGMKCKKIYLFSFQMQIIYRLFIITYKVFLFFLVLFFSTFFVFLLLILLNTIICKKYNTIMQLEYLLIFQLLYEMENYNFLIYIYNLQFQLIEKIERMN